MVELRIIDGVTTNPSIMLKDGDTTLRTESGNSLN